MTMAEDVVRPDALAASDGGLALTLHLPWYRSLPISCLEGIDVTVAGTAAPVVSVAIPGFTGSIADAAASEAWWDVRDPIEVTLAAEAPAGEPVPLEVRLAVRIPYLQQAPGVPLVQHAVVRTEATVR